MEYISNTRIIKISKLFIGIADLNTKYNLKDIYSNLEHFESKGKSEFKRNKMMLNAFITHTNEN